MNRIKDWTLYIIHTRPVKSDNEWVKTRRIFADPDTAIAHCQQLNNFTFDMEYAVFEFILNDTEKVV